MLICTSPVNDAPCVAFRQNIDNPKEKVKVFELLKKDLRYDDIPTLKYTKIAMRARFSVFPFASTNFLTLCGRACFRRKSKKQLSTHRQCLDITFSLSPYFHL